jgi:hypothetical protein
MIKKKITGNETVAIFHFQETRHNLIHLQHHIHQSSPLFTRRSIMNNYTLLAFSTAFQEYFVKDTVNFKQSTEKKNEKLYAWHLRQFLESEEATFNNADAIDAMLDPDVKLFGDARVDPEVELYADEAVFPLWGPLFSFDEKELAEPDEQDWQNVVLPF